MIQRELATLYLVKDPQEVWGTYCRDCATKAGESFGLVWNTYKFMAENMLTPNGVERPQGEEVEPIVFAPEIYETDVPLGCEDCGLYLESSLTKDGVEYLQDPLNEFPQNIIKLYLGEN